MPDTYRRKKSPYAAPGDPVDDSNQILAAESATTPVEVREKRAHDVVEARCPAGVVTNGKVQECRQVRSLRVIVHAERRRIVVADPRGRGRVGRRDVATCLIALDFGDRSRDVADEAPGIPEPGAVPRQGGVVGCESFGHPEQRRLRLPRIVVGPQLHRADALDVPQ